MGITNCCQQKIQNKPNHKQPKTKRASNASIKHITPASPLKKKKAQFSCERSKTLPCTDDSLTPEAKPQKKRRGPQDYQHLKYLGKGAFGCVVLAQQKATNRRYAMKIIQKNKIKQFNLLQCDRIKDIGHTDFLVSIKQTFQNKSNIYIIMEYLPMGDLYYYLRKREFPFSEQTVANIAAEIVVTIGLLHSQGIVYRQLKPENILITEEGHIKLTDYGLSKVIIQNRHSVSTFIGTLEYMAPQAYSGDFGQKADIWSIGILMYELLFKQNLFQIDDQRITHVIKQGAFPIERQHIAGMINSRIGFMSMKFRDLLLKLLEQDPNKRIGLEQIRSHQFFANINWGDVESRNNDPPLKQLKEKRDMIKYRDATAEKYFRRQYVKQRTLKENYQINLYQFRNSQ